MAGRIQTEIKHTFILLNLLYLAVGCVPTPTATDFFCYKTDSLRAGDIILRKSYGLLSDIIVKQLNDSTNISHCGIICTDSINSFYIIHSLSKMVSESDGMQKCSLNDFMNDSRIETVKVFRFRMGNGEVIEQMAKYYLGRKIPFDLDFNIQDSTKFNCSELPIHIINLVYRENISQSKVKPNFSIFQNPEYFDEISFVEADLSKY